MDAMLTSVRAPPPARRKPPSEARRRSTVDSSSSSASVTKLASRTNSQSVLPSSHSIKTGSTNAERAVDERLSSSCLSANTTSSRNVPAWLGGASSADSLEYSHNFRSVVLPHRSGSDSLLNRPRITSLLAHATLRGWLEKQGVGVLGSAWRRRYFELRGDQLLYFEGEPATPEGLRGRVLIGDITLVKACAAEAATSHVASSGPHLSSLHSHASPLEGYRFFLSTRDRRFELRTVESGVLGLERMWYWIEGLNTALTRHALEIHHSERQKRMEVRESTAASASIERSGSVRTAEIAALASVGQQRDHAFIASELQGTLERERRERRQAEIQFKYDIDTLHRKLALLQMKPDSHRERDFRLSNTTEPKRSDDDDDLDLDSPAFTLELLRLADEQNTALARRIAELEAENKRLRQEQKTRSEKLHAQRIEESGQYHRKCQKLESALAVSNAALEREKGTAESLRAANNDLNIELERALQGLSQPQSVPRPDNDGVFSHSFQPVTRSLIHTDFGTCGPGGLRVYAERWAVDQFVHRCSLCRNEFGVLRWKHFCRCCGDVFCGDCANYFALLIGHPHLPQDELQRVCRTCAHALHR